jgi:sulfatase maturation enzyme AslB (radical SAM superfamily)
VVPPGPFSPITENAPLYKGGGGERSFIAPYSIKPAEWGRFLCAIFDEWVKHDVGETFVNVFDATLAGWMGMMYNRENDLCNFSKPNVQKPRFFARLSGFVFG